MKASSLALILLVVCASAFGGSLPDHRHLATTGHGMVKVKPNMAVLSLAVSAARKTSLAAKQEVDARVSRFLAQLKGLDIKRADISASELITRPEYIYNDKHERVLQDWMARRPLVITLRALGRLNELMNAALKAGVDQVENTQLKVSNEDRYEHQALNRAIDDSKAKARALAKAYGASLGPIYSIHYDNAEPVQPVIHMAAFAKQRVAEPDTYLRQKITFQQSIQVVFDLTVSK